MSLLPLPPDPVDSAGAPPVDALRVAHNLTVGGPAPAPRWGRGKLVLGNSRNGTFHWEVPPEEFPTLTYTAVVPAVQGIASAISGAPSHLTS